MTQLALEPGIPASRICQVIGFNKGPISRTLAVMQKRGLVAIRDRSERCPHAFDLADGEGAGHP